MLQDLLVRSDEAPSIARRGVVADFLAIGSFCGHLTDGLDEKTRNVDPASPWLHYVLHHVFQSYRDHLPEWQKDTTAENAKWLMEKVQPVRKLDLETVN